MMLKADLIEFARGKHSAEVGDGVQSSIVQVHALGLGHKDGAAEACQGQQLILGKAYMYSLPAKFCLSWALFLSHRQCRHRPAHS